MADPTDLAALFGQVDELHTPLTMDGQEDEALTVLAFPGRAALSELATYVLTVGSSVETSALLDDALGRQVVCTVARADDDTSLHTASGVMEISDAMVKIN